MKDFRAIGALSMLIPLLCCAQMDPDDPEVIAAEALFAGATKKENPKPAHRTSSTMRSEGAPASLLEIGNQNAVEARQKLVSATRNVVRSELQGLNQYLSDLFPEAEENPASLMQSTDQITDPSKTIADLEAMDRDIKRQRKPPKHPQGVETFALRPFEDDEEKQLDELDKMMNPSKKRLPPIPDRKKESMLQEKAAEAKAHRIALEKPPDEDDVTKAQDGSEDSMERIARALHKQTSFNPMIQAAKQKRQANAEEALKEQIDWSKERELDKKNQWPPAPNDLDQPQPHDDLSQILLKDSASTDGKVDLLRSTDDPLNTFGKDDLDKLLGKQ